MPRGFARACTVGARARITSQLQQGSTRCEIGCLVERDAFSQYVPRGRQCRAAGDVRADSAAIVAKVLCNIKEKEFKATL